MPFENRIQAGRQLAAALGRYRDHDPVVLALPRGGVPVAAEVAAALDAPLDLIMVRKIGVPVQPELAMGAVVDGPQPLVVRNDDVIASSGISEGAFDAAYQSEMAEIESRRQRFLGDRAHVDIAGCTAIVVDDGVATGATTRAALRAVRQRGPRSVVLAIPVAPTTSLPGLSEEADDVVCLEDHEWFGAIGMYYADFGQLSDQEVTDILARFPTQRPQRTGTSR